MIMIAVFVHLTKWGAEQSFSSETEWASLHPEVPGWGGEWVAVCMVLPPSTEGLQ